MNGKTKNDVYSRVFEIMSLRKEMEEMRKKYVKLKIRLEELEKKEEKYRNKVDKK